MVDCLAFLAGIVGNWEGEGVNHEGQVYTGRLVVEAPVNAAAIILRFTATGVYGELYHQEILMAGSEEGGDMAAYSASNNLAGIARFSIVQSGPEAVVFTLGALDNFAGFRETITLRLEGAELFHGFAWAMPGEVLRERSSARLLFAGV